MNINELLIYGRKEMLDANVTDIPLKIRLLAEHVLNMHKYDLVINHLKEITENEFQHFKDGLQKLKNGFPIQYITNKQEFMKLNFFVDENVLIPQPDTEILVEEVIKYCSNIKNKIKILDLCTGSGAIAVSLAKYIDNCEVTATDISFKAIQIAKLNAERNMVNNKITFIESDMFTSIDLNSFDIIVSNPPYIETQTLNTLDSEVLNEPIIALDGGIDGLSFYKEIANTAYTYLNEDGILFLEIGYNQKDSVSKLLEETAKYKNIRCIKDLANNNRVIICEKN